MLKISSARKLTSTPSDVNLFRAISPRELIQLCERNRRTRVSLYRRGLSVTMTLSEVKKSILACEMKAGRHGIGNGLQFAKLGVREVGSGLACGLSFAGDLQHADHAARELDGCAHDFLDRIAALLFS